MKIVCIGGGPAGLYFSLLMKKHHPGHQITVVERNRACDTFGWGVVFSDQTLARLVQADEASARAILQSFNHWDNIDIHFKGEKITSGGHGFCGIGRKRLLNILQRRCQELGVHLVFETEVGDELQLAERHGADLVIASDGLNSRIRARHADSYRPAIEARRCRFVWLGTKQKFAAFTFAFRQTEHGWFQAHIYQYDGDTSTFIVETPETVWRSAGLDAMSREEGIAFCERLFADLLGGHALLSNAGHLPGAAMWITFQRIVNEQWVHWNGAVPVVLIGDAAHSAHYSIGSGTRLALEDAIELAHCLAPAAPDLGAALAAYQERRAVEVAKLQSAARNSMEWFENVERYSAMEAPQFAYSMLTRSQRLSHENLRLRDPAYVAGYEAWLAARALAQAGLGPAAGAA
ncbi:MAG TPA: FAD-dependent monooxygenase, partial [Janthinobacterium sp.]|nr:FAD-dependent monooxygenase [Janthinobacterium sp.]